MVLVERLQAAGIAFKLERELPASINKARL
jgi:hypothetical protein